MESSAEIPQGAIESSFDKSENIETDSEYEIIIAEDEPPIDLPYLPPEIWLLILHNITDIADILSVTETCWMFRTLIFVTVEHITYEHYSISYPLICKFPKLKTCSIRIDLNPGDNIVKLFSCEELSLVCDNCDIICDWIEYIVQQKVTLRQLAGKSWQFHTLSSKLAPLLQYVNNTIILSEFDDARLIKNINNLLNLLPITLCCNFLSLHRIIQQFPKIQKIRRPYDKIFITSVLTTLLNENNFIISVTCPRQDYRLTSSLFDHLVAISAVVSKGHTSNKPFELCVPIPINHVPGILQIFPNLHYLMVSSLFSRDILLREIDVTLKRTMHCVLADYPNLHIGQYNNVQDIIIS